MGTFMAKKEEAKRNWVLIDVKDQVLGRAASKIADVLRGKHRPTFTPHVDNGDFVVVINAAHVKLTGQKWEEKMYYNHSGFMGGLKEQTAEELREKHPEDLITRAVKGMLPKNFLSKKLMTKLKVYSETEHPHKAQNPTELKLNS